MMKHPNVHKLTLIENRISDKLNWICILYNELSMYSILFELY